MKISTKNKTYIFILFLVVILLYNSYRNTITTAKEGYSDYFKDKTKLIPIRNIKNKRYVSFNNF